MLVELKDLKGEVKKKIRLPPAFDQEFRPDLIKKAVLAIQSTRYQPHGAHPYAGIRTSAHSWGSGRGVSHVPRIKTGSRAARVPQARGGREAHPPKVEKVLVEKVNKKEKRKALLSAIAATTKEDLVRARGHRFEAKLPIVIEEAFEKLERTSDVIAVLQAAGVYPDVERARASRKVRPAGGRYGGATTSRGRASSSSRKASPSGRRGTLQVSTP